METNSRRIARNAVMLYLRMLLTMVVGLYTSRVVLQTLGVEDFGVYGVVGGIVAMMGFLNASMSGATSRFLTFELGRGDHDRLARTFSSALIVHIIIALVVLVVAETVGLWFLTNKLVIPPGRMTAAHWVYQLSIASAMLSITQAPYNATIIAHEKMDVYAYVEILNATLKLLIVYLLVIGNFDKLILYGVLTFVVSVIIMLVYRIYCIRHFTESHFHPHWDKQILRGILSFSGYNIFGNLGSVFNTQGTNFAINIFFGVVYNAGASVATTISSIVTSFASNVMTAFRPQITKQYAVQDFEQFQSLMQWAIKIILLIYAIVAVPVSIVASDLLALWLVEVPPLASLFCQLILISIFFETLRYIIIMGIHATGNVKWVSLTTGTLFILNPLIVYFLYCWGMHPAVAFMSAIAVNIVLGIIDFYLLKQQIRQVKIRCIVMDTLRVIITTVVVISVSIKMVQYMGSLHALSRVVLLSMLSTAMFVATSLLVCFNANQRQRIIQQVKKKLHITQQ